jgi:Ca2+-binding RTX toxin-like protein
MRTFKTWATAAAATALLAFAPGAAQAATIGSNSIAPDFHVTCVGPGIWVSASYVVPSAGTITSFTYQSETATQGTSQGDDLAFKVLRPTGGSSYEVVGTTDVVELQTADQLETFTPASPIAVQAGDVLGFWQPGELDGCLRNEGPNASSSGQPTDPPVGATVTTVFTPSFGELNLSAEFTPTPPTATCSNTPATISGSGTITGTAGDDVIVGSDGADVIEGGGGNDLICAGGGNDRVLGGDGDDRIFGGEGNDNLNGEAGNDKVFGEAGDDRVFGAAGHDTVFGNAGNDYGNGGAGDDVMNGGVGDDELEGSNGDDFVQGSEGNDDLDGGVGFDTAEGGAGTDTFAFFEVFIGPGANGVPG